MKSFFGKRPAVARGTGGTAEGSRGAWGGPGTGGEAGKKAGKESSGREAGADDGKMEGGEDGKRSRGADGGGTAEAVKKPRRRKRRRGRGERNVVRRRLRGASAGYACRGMCRRACGGVRERRASCLRCPGPSASRPDAGSVAAGSARGTDASIAGASRWAGRMLPAFFVLSAVFSLSSDTLTTG